MRTTCATLVLLAFGAAACGSPAEPPKTPAPAPSGPSLLPLPVPDQEAKTILEVVVIPTAWVQKTLPAPPADVKAWSEVAANRAAIVTDVRHVLVKVDKDEAGAKKKAEALLARLQKGEDWAKVAKASDDPGSKDKGGLYDGEMVQNFVEPFQKAYAALAPGETTKELVRSNFGWHVIKRETPTEEQTVKAYRKAKAPELTKKLADDLLIKLRTKESSRASIAQAVEGVLGESANADPARPSAQTTDLEHLDGSRLPREAKDALAAFGKKAKTGEAVEAPIVTPKALVVARMTADAR